MLLFLIRCDDLVKAELQNGDRVSELLLHSTTTTLGCILASSGSCLGLVESFIIEFNRLVSLF
jgi:hypothetical protein